MHPPGPGTEPPTGSFRVVHEDGGPVLHLHGDVDEPLVRRMRAAGLPEGELVAVQVAAVGYIDSTGLSLLVRWAQQAARDGRPAVLRAASPRFCKVLDLAGISVLFVLEDDGHR
ncbi:anti-sigma factor antagonist [Geodermatophilus sp. DF01-2]|uniref:STAS domain-containing protein n=1 Tax=Geodermatophilus sp. DF01-2 TaxID=2559610 RepID=UPI00107485DD|nr:STAS domain-containing protein [Geodermatophilus sp. DF01_2]TFV54776.1 anti-sigma factor antagonist [Geodermatophilus sp. DF01_2]